MMQSYLRNALLAIVALAAFAATSTTTASAQSAGSVTITVNEPTDIGGQIVLAPGAYHLRHSSGDWYLTLEDAVSRRTLGFIRYESTTEGQGNEAQVTTTELAAGAPAKVAITSVYIPASGRAYSFPVNERTASAAASAGK
jgi:hypothetical protein